MNVSFILMMYNHILCLSCLLIATVSLTVAVMKEDATIYNFKDLHQILKDVYHMP